MTILQRSRFSHGWQLDWMSSAGFQTGSSLCSVTTYLSPESERHNSALLSLTVQASCTRPSPLCSHFDSCPGKSNAACVLLNRIFKAGEEHRLGFQTAGPVNKSWVDSPSSWSRECSTVHRAAGRALMPRISLGYPVGDPCLSLTQPVRGRARAHRKSDSELYFSFGDTAASTSCAAMLSLLVGSFTTSRSLLAKDLWTIRP